MNLDLVLVTYNPDLELLNKVLNSIFCQVRNIYVVDNSTNDINNVFFEGFNNIKYIPLNENKGIAYAQNVGIKESMKNNSEYILLSDQDTIYPNNFIVNIFSGVHQDFAALSPLFSDLYQKKDNQGFVIKGKFGFENIFPKEGIHKLQHVIASGCVLKVEHLSDIGLMDEDLFIDWVDLEWCWRAKAKGFDILGNANVIIQHQLGDKAINIGIREVNLRNPTRHYYITRNAFYLSIYSDFLSRKEKVILFLKSFRYILGFSLLSKPHGLNVIYTMKGFIHGVSKKLGPLVVKK